jgi:A118 family predicted phage portal protein
MNITETARSVWLLIFGKKLDRSLVDGNKLIEVWHDIYAGRPEWQTYTTQGIGGRKTVNRYLLNAGKIVTSELAGLVFAEEPNITASDSIREVLKYNKFTSNMQSWLDKGLALGGGALKWVLRPGELPIIDYVTAPDFVPVSYDSRGISEADFLSSVVNDGREYRVVEQHRKSKTGYTVSIKVYEKIILGGGDDYREVSPERAGVSGVSVDVPVKLFEAWKNPEANNIDVYSPLGISIYANALDTLRQLDEAFDYLARELDTSRRKIIIDKAFLGAQYDSAKGKSQVYYNKNDEVYVAFDAAEKKDMAPTPIDFELRIDAIRATIQVLLALLSKQCGLSDGFLSFDGVSMKTATEVISENSKTFRTKKNIENSLTEAIVPFLSALLVIGGEYGVKVSAADKIAIEWDDSVIEDRNSRAKYYLDRLTAKAITLEDALIGMDGLTEEEAKAKADEIRAGNATVSVGDIFGDKGEL